MFTNLEDFPHCNQCIKAYQDTDVEVTCKSDGGSPPVNFSISSIKDGVRMELFSEQSLIEEVSYKLQVTEEFAWAKISCDVRNDASKVPLSTSAIVYLLSKLTYSIILRHISNIKSRIIRPTRYPCKISRKLHAKKRFEIRLK